MTNLMRIRAQWAGTGVTGPSVSTFYWDAAVTGGPAAVRAFFDAVKGQLPNTLTITVDSTGDIILDTDGSLIGSWTESAGSPVAGTDNNAFVNGTGLRISWQTAGIYRGRRVKGSTFLVPVGRDLYNAQGIIDAGHLATVQTAADALVAAGGGDFKVYSREVQADPTHVPPIVHTDGTASGVTGAVAHNAVSWLRSRRT